jgi:ATP-binding cassette subfamily F protein 3
MSLITVNNLSKSFGPVDLFSGISFAIPKGARLALVGPNGCGKTTLLRILIGLDESSGGTIGRARGIRIGYLPQEAEFEMDGTLWEACIAVFSDLIARQAELEKLEAEMSVPEKRQQALARYGPLQREFERRGGYSYHTRIQQVLTGLGFSAGDQHLPLAHLSGGQRTRAFLARLLLSEPDLLLLDEPTNHLDMPAREALQEVLENFSGTILLVSHDRYLIDRLATQIWDLHGSHLHMFQGSYREYILRRVTPGTPAPARQILLTPKPMIRDNSKQTRQRVLDLAMLEERIREKEKDIQRLSGELQKAGQAGTFDRINKISWQVAQAQAALESLMSEWEKLAV